MHFVIEIVIAIASGLAVQPIQRWLARYGSRSHAKRLKSIKAEYGRTMYYALHHDFLLGKLIIAAIFTSFEAMALVFIVKIDVTPGSPLPWTWHPHFPLPRYLDSLLNLIVFALLILSVIFALRMVIDAVWLFERVQTLDKYIETVPDELRDHESESVILAIEKHRWRSGVPEYVLQELVKSLSGTSDENKDQDKG